MTDETPNSESGNDTSKPSKKTLKPNKLKIKACDLEVEAESNEETVEEIVGYLSPKMESLMRHHLAGQLCHFYFPHFLYVLLTPV
ncbi:hypothetical protein EA462_06960 [Natrarchaeobius halalkaliphilus]|uniref:Uncharacterized protein n=1 Tax=Natrarchaeobius halalkaliphilus TaxID=1679091 RepID=A0A3N6LQ32_9EURY|nr:hypothetical protein [Natrarchaeobius halalkaliphilus]RQG91678.1 hypothetical protein EA462_06960 [Natrarchaeobius halalkaliphilus]